MYIKMDAPESLLLSEGVCRQLGIVTYHPSILNGPNCHCDLQLSASKLGENIQKSDPESTLNSRSIPLQEEKIQRSDPIQPESTLNPRSIPVQEEKIQRNDLIQTESTPNSSSIPLQVPVRGKKIPVPETKIWKSDVSQTSSTLTPSSRMQNDVSSKYCDMLAPSAILVRRSELPGITQNKNNNMVSSSPVESDMMNMTERDRKHKDVASQTDQIMMRSDVSGLDQGEVNRVGRSSDGITLRCIKPQHNSISQHSTVTEDYSQSTSIIDEYTNCSNQEEDSHVADGRFGYQPRQWCEGESVVEQDETEGSPEGKLCSTSATVPLIRVYLLQSVKLLPYQCRSVWVKTDVCKHTGPLLIEYDENVEKATGLHVQDAIFTLRDGVARLVVSNHTGFTQVVGEGEELGTVMEVTVIKPEESEKSEETTCAQLMPPNVLPDISITTDSQPALSAEKIEKSAETIDVQVEEPHVMPYIYTFTDHKPAPCVEEVNTAARTVEASVILPDAQMFTVSVDQQTCSESRCRKIEEMVEFMGIAEVERIQLIELLKEHHAAFSLEDGERGETDLVEMEIDTGDAKPKRQRIRRMPFAVRQEVSRQLKSMQSMGVIQPSNSPWASPVVMVRKKDGTSRFCVDYRELNSVTRQDAFPLPRIDDLLDQLGQSHYFSTLDLASGYWQIRVHPTSIPKTAFITPQGSFEFLVMPFGLTNAPSVFQRLMQQVLRDLNPEDGPDFVSVYIDDVLIFSRNLDEHLQHLQLVINRLQNAGLKLKPSKCHFMRKEVEYLGHLVTPQGLKTNPRLISAVKEFPAPQNPRETRQFLGLCSYYRRFIPSFSKIAQPLHTLTKKNTQFEWSYRNVKKPFPL